MIRLPTTPKFSQPHSLQALLSRLYNLSPRPATNHLSALFRTTMMLCYGQDRGSPPRAAATHCNRNLPASLSSHGCHQAPLPLAATAATNCSPTCRCVRRPARLLRPPWPAQQPARCGGQMNRRPDCFYFFVQGPLCKRLDFLVILIFWT
jgi:hypothetical protein